MQRKSVNCTESVKFTDKNAYFQEKKLKSYRKNVNFTKSEKFTEKV